MSVLVLEKVVSVHPKDFFLKFLLNGQELIYVLTVNRLSVPIPNSNTKQHVNNKQCPWLNMT